MNRGLAFRAGLKRLRQSCSQCGVVGGGGQSNGEAEMVQPGLDKGILSYTELDIWEYLYSARLVLFPVSRHVL